MSKTMLEKEAREMIDYLMETAIDKLVDQGLEGEDLPDSKEAKQLLEALKKELNGRKCI